MNELSNDESEVVTTETTNQQNKDGEDSNGKQIDPSPSAASSVKSVSLRPGIIIPVPLSVIKFASSNIVFFNYSQESQTFRTNRDFVFSDVKLHEK